MMYTRDNYSLSPAAISQIDRAMELADALEDCIDVYMQEIANEDTQATRMMARSILADRLGGDDE